MGKEERTILDFFVILLQIIFLGLKLNGVIAWSWVVVLLPVIILSGIYGAIILIYLIAIILDWFF